jgi:6-phosphogluconolactonase
MRRQLAAATGFVTAKSSPQTPEDPMQPKPMYTRAGLTTLLAELLTTVLAAGALIGTAACSDTKDDKKGTIDPATTHPMVYVGGDGNITWYAMGGDGSMTSMGSLKYPLTAAWITKSADNKFLYALLRTTNEAAQTAAMAKFEGYVQAYAIDQGTGALTEVGTRVSSQGDRPTYITLDKTGKWALVANNLGHLVGKSIAVFPINADGSVGEAVQSLNAGTDPANMDKPFVRSHTIRLDPSNRYVYVANIDSDNISQFKFDAATGMLTPNDPATVAIPNPGFPTTSSSPTNAKLGIGPRHLDFHPSKPWVYLSTEYGAQVVQLKMNDNGTLEMMPPPVSGLPDGYSSDPNDKWQSEIRIHPNGRFLYVGERARTAMVSEQTVAIFDVNPTTGAVTRKANEPCLGKTPRNLALDPTGNWLVVANQDPAKPTDMPQPAYPFSSIVVYKIDQATGLLKKTFGPVEQMNPFVVLFVTLP